MGVPTGAEYRTINLSTPSGGNKTKSIFNTANAKTSNKIPVVPSKLLYLCLRISLILPVLSGPQTYLPNQDVRQGKDFGFPS